MKKHVGLLAGILLLLPAASASAQQVDHPYQNPDLPLETRVDDLIGRMTLEEKVSQTTNASPPIERLGIPGYNWWNEALHGVARSGLATVFPQAVGLAATWNTELIHEMATAISDEGRAKYQVYAEKGKYYRYQGLTFWSPNINLFRDPRWGRGQETYGEDPYLTGSIAVSFIKGLQGDDPEYLKSVATVKHFAIHSGPESERHTFDAVVGERDLRESYLPQFERGIREAGARSLMCAYNRVDGDPACASPMLLKDILRGEWGFDGYVVSDCWALDDIYKNHKTEATAEAAAAVALQTGTDLDCGNLVYPHLLQAIQDGMVSEATLDETLRRLFRARFRLGMFDPPERVPFASIPYDVVDSEAHRELARRVTREAMVLLKNDNETLPLRKDLGRLAVIGPNADQWLMLLGNYNGTPGTLVTPLEGIRAAAGDNTEVLYARGSDLAEGSPFYELVPGEALLGPDGQPGLLAQYYDGATTEGEPLFSERIDGPLDANWHDGAPQADMDDDNFSVLWSGYLAPVATGTYSIGVISQSKFELFINDELVARSQYRYRDEFGDPRVTSAEPVHLEAGTRYEIRIEATESYGDAQIQLVWDAPETDLLGEAVAAAEHSDAVVMFLGLSPRLEGEEMPIEIDGFRGGDRTNLELPAVQQRLLEAVVATGKPVVLVLLNGSALSINWADANVPAILEAWYPGQAAGTAIADVLFGDYNPAGRLPVTFYKSVNDLPPFDDYDMEGRTYRFFDGEVLYPFGHGLSYTTFEYSNLVVSGQTLPAAGEVTVSVDITNTGDRAGDEVVQLYVEYPESSVARPIRDLRGFERVTLEAGATTTAHFVLGGRDVAYWSEERSAWKTESTPVRLVIGSSSADARVATTVAVEAN